jgi:DNA-directed RNA polymerase subunit beta'
MKNIVDFKGLQIKLAAPDIVRSWSRGEVLKPETINYRTLKPEKDGLFCERIFGPTKDWECYCGKYKRIRYRGIVCDKCGVEVTLSRVRRERMGHIDLACPVAHVWFFKGAPSKISLLLDISPRNLSSIIYFSQYVVLEVDSDKRQEVVEQLEVDLEAKKDELKDEAKQAIEQETESHAKHLAEITSQIKSKEQQELKVSELSLKSKQKLQQLKATLDNELINADNVYKAVKEIVKRLDVKSIITEDEYLKLLDYNAADHLRVGMGAEAILELIRQIDLESLVSILRQESKEATGAKKVKATKRLRVAEGMKKSGINPEWMILRVTPVIPPDLRPMVQLSGGRFASSDLNDLYRRVINRNNRLKHLMDLGAPEIILRNEKRMLQEAVDALIDSSQSKDTTRRVRKELRSLSEMLRGKQGRFRQNLLGKRVDYSGRSVIVVGPELNLNQCGIPKDMALEMFRPYVLRELIKEGIAPNVKSAKHALARRSPEVYDILERIIQNHPVLLNRAPTLHKLGIQAFFPVLVEGNAIRIHPCVCAGYNADFDGDQMAVHVPLSKAAQQEAIDLMMPGSNLLKPADGSPITVPNKEMVMGSYYMTTFDHLASPYPTIFASQAEAVLAYQSQQIGLRQPIKVRMSLGLNQPKTIVETCMGRILLNEVLPEELRFINKSIGINHVKELVRKAIKLCPKERVVQFIDDFKNLGFWAATISGLSVSVADNIMIDDKALIIEEANKRAESVQDNFRMGLITSDEKRRLTQEIWMETTDTIADKTWASYEPNNAVKIMIDSGGTRASKDQVKQLGAMRGLVVDPLGKIVELPTKSNFREGLSIFEYVTSTRGSRKGLTDSALKTADAGYLTRRLVDVAHDAIIRYEDCGTDEHIVIAKSDRRGQLFGKRILGRIAAKDIKAGNKALVKKNELIDEEAVEAILNTDIDQAHVFSPLTCHASYGLCAKCYGRDFSTKEQVTLGAPVGVIAAQSIGEPGTQLTMRVKHAGGIVGLDVTQGLPRVEELFEIRIPKNVAPLAEIAGQVTVDELDSSYKVTIKSTSKPVQLKEYTVPLAAILKVATGDVIAAGTQLAQGSLDIKEVLAIRGLLGAQQYLVDEIQSVYESQGIQIHDRHFEVTIRRMSDKVVVEDSGDTSLLPGEIIDKAAFNRENQAVISEGGDPATAVIIILGVSSASLHTQSWLSAASFQETTNILTDASIQGKEDYLIGLKENVIIGRLIPTSPERAIVVE